MKIKLILSTIFLTNCLSNLAMDEQPPKTPNDMLLSGAQYNNIDLIKQALAEKANINYQNDFGSTALMLNILNSIDQEITKLLLDSKADVNIQTKYKGTIFFIEMNRFNTDRFKLLLNEGADLSLRNSDDLTAFDIAKKCYRVDLLEILTSHLEAQKKQIKTEVDKYLPPVLGNIVDKYLFDKNVEPIEQ